MVRSGEAHLSGQGGRETSGWQRGQNLLFDDNWDLLLHSAEALCLVACRNDSIAVPVPLRCA